ncbi:MAG: hypothetical protein PHW66_06315 [Gallionella sp.]|nr:hypothetical protein [Gallionella sp.]
MKPDTKRVAKLRKLVGSAGGPAAFAKSYSQEDADKPIDHTYVSQILNGHRSFGEKAARNMERRAGLPDGYFDLPDEENINPRLAHLNKLLEDQPDYVIDEVIKDVDSLVELLKKTKGNGTQ